MIIRYKPIAILRSFGHASTKIPTIIAKIADKVNTIDTITSLLPFLPLI